MSSLAISNRTTSDAPLFVILVCAGLAGNYFNFPIFFNIDFLFGSIFAMLALQFFGLGAGILAAFLIASYTYFLWNEPYAMVLMTAELAVVGWLTTRRAIGMVLGDALYWLLLGMPLGFLFYKVVLDVAASSAYIILTKQAVNGIVNALIARLIFTAFAQQTRASRISYRDLIYNLLTFFALCPALLLLALASRSDFAETDLGIRNELRENTQRVSDLFQYSRQDGSVTDVLDQQRVSDYLNRTAGRVGLLYALVDNNDKVVLSNHQEQWNMSRLARGPGTLIRLDKTISQWVPTLAPGTSASEIWKSSFYVTETAAGRQGEWKLVLEQPVAPFQQLLYTRYAHALALVFVILLVALLLAEFLSRRIMKKGTQIEALAQDLPAKLEAGDQIVWPETTLMESQRTIHQFKEMVDALSKQFKRVRELNESLEQRVQERTAELQESERRFRTLIEWTPEAIAVLRNGIVIYANPSAVKLFGAKSSTELLGKPILQFVHPSFHEIVTQRMKSISARDINAPMIEEKALKLDGTAFDAEVRSTWINYAGQASIQVAIRDVTQSKHAEEAIRHLAFFDALTGLPNRRLLLDRLGQALTASARHQRRGALLFIDLDDFKTLNDTLGHANGDLILQQVAKRLASCIRDCDTVARLGGDEFVAMLEDLSENELIAATQAETVGYKVLATLSQPHPLAGAERHCTSSIGITLFGGELEDTEEPLKRADLAMYQAKAAGHNTLRFFDPQMQAEVAARASMEMELREGLEKQHFLLYYQAQMTDEHRITGAEVLLRWSHPVRGMEVPASFISLAEETGLIVPLGQWVLTSACTQLAMWARQPALAQLKIAVNISERQFRQADFVAQVQEVLQRTGARPDLLRLELQESVMTNNVENVIAKMQALKALGIGFAMDDFGSGYSSFSYLKRLPLDELKIDLEVVRDILIDPDNAAIAKMIVVLAESLTLSIIAEGVETDAQLKFLAALGCHNYQGYLHGRPVPVQEFEARFAGPLPG